MPYRYHYDPNQPRVPAGQHDSGQWTINGGAHRPPLQQVQYDPRSVVIQKGAEAAALALFALLSRRNNYDQRAILEFKARQYNRNIQEPFAADKEAFSEENVKLLTRDEVNRICKRLWLVQMLTDDAAISERPFRDSMSPTQYGTRIHSIVKNQIDSMNDPNFKAEVSQQKAIEEERHNWVEDRKKFNQSLDANPDVASRYGAKNTVRIDVLERTNPTTVCVYDIKTGWRGLSRPRFDEIARAVLKNFGAAQQIIITEVRPMQ